MSQPSHPDPFELLLRWRDEALARGLTEPDAMTLATATPDGRPSARVVLFRGLSGGGLRFFTNYESRKGRELEANPHAALLFHWAELGRQVRVEGTVERLSPEESDEYFHARPRGNQLGAWASPQSRLIASREELLARQAEAAARFGHGEIPRPPYWGGFRVVPHAWEFWTAGADRLHDRVLYVRREGGWEVSRVAP